MLIWNSLPQGNTPPDIVLGQPDFNSNNPGADLNQMNWPASITTDGQRVLVADTYNDRILIWTEFPSQNGVPADIVLDGKAGLASFGQVSKTSFHWPWGIWTDGEKVALTSTQGGYVLIWNSFPSQNNQPADLYLTAGGNLGTPRTITSDGQHLIVGDHNARNTSNNIGNFFWSSFPTTDDEPCDFFAPDPVDPYGAWLQGDFTADGKLVMLGSTLHVWNSFPANAGDRPDVSITGFKFRGGDGAGAVIAGDQVFISVYNSNQVLVYNHVPDDSADLPDYTIGSPDINTKTLDTHYFITNGIPATNGKAFLFLLTLTAAGMSGKSSLMKAAHTLILSTRLMRPPGTMFSAVICWCWRARSVLVWPQLPLNGQLPSLIFKGSIGDIEFEDLQGVAMDDHYFYLSDASAEKVYVWEGIPENKEVPLFILDIKGPGRLSSDGE